MNASKPYTDRSNCIRAARKAFGVPKGMPGVDFHVECDADGQYRFAQPAEPAAAEIMADATGNDNLVAGADLLAQVASAMAAGTLAATADALAVQSKTAAKKVRADLVTMVGKSKTRLTITSGRNAGYQKHADALFDLAQKGDGEGLSAYPIRGTNTYCRMLRRYRDALATAA